MLQRQGTGPRRSELERPAEQRLLSQETIARILSATEALLPSQRAVTTLHDREG